MNPKRIFISSVQKEFAAERAVLRDWLRGDALIRRFFEPFLFEDMPAADRRADAVYLEEVARCDLYVGLFGDEYGVADAEGLSPTAREFAHATALNKYRLIFVKGADDAGRQPKMQALIRRRFVSTPELIAGLYAALVQYLEDQELIRNGPFDAAPCRNATLADLDEERMATFLRRARKARGFPLPEEATPQELLTHLNLLDAGRPTHAAVLLFGRQPQRFLIFTRGEVRAFPRQRGGEADPVVSGLQGHCVRSGGSGGGFRHVQDQPVGGHARSRAAGAGGL